MTTHRFQVVKVRRSHRGKCPHCGGKASRSQSFEATVNPYNKNPDGSIRSYSQVYDLLLVEADAWVPDFTHDRCRGYA